MQAFLRQYNKYIIKLLLLIKRTTIINFLFISLAYPLSNTFQYKNDFIKVTESDSDSYIMQKAFEAELLAKEFKYKEAAEIYHQICMKSEDPEVAKRATQLAGFANDYDLMLKNSDRWLHTSKDKISVRHVRISIFLALDKTKEATEETLLAIEISKDKDKFALVYDTLRVFDDKVIKKIFDSIYKKYKNEYLANFYYVQILLNNNMYTNAIDLIKSMSKFKEFSKKESRWGIFLADAYYEIGERELSIKTLKDYLQYSPKNLYLNEYYVRILTLQEMYIEAIQHYRFMSANKLIDFSDTKTAKKMALLNIEVNNFSDAKNFIDSFKEKDINSYNYISGLLNAKDKKYSAAEKFFMEIDIEDTNYINAIQEIAKIKISQNKFQSLKKIFKEQYNKLKNKPTIETNLILIETEIFFSEEKFYYAMERINYGLKKYKDHGAFLYTRALVAEKVDRFDILEEDLIKLIKLEPKNAQALNALGYSWANNNMRLDEANKYIDKALALEPNDAAILDSKGWVMFRLGKFKEAEKYLLKAMDLNDDPEIVSHVIQLFVKLEKIKDAKRVYKKYIKLKPKDKRLIKLKKMLNEI